MDEIGFQTITSSGVIGTSGKAVAVYGYAFKSDGTAGVITLRNGAGSGASAVWDQNGTINVTVINSLAYGVVYPNGLYVSLDAHVTTATIFFRQVVS